ncbi:hypothetical protein V5799_033773 [Amblyomma americanum]|uniref:Uncharacterized protein n=1 Tax=Amblyomma americanum TaxID=6943 RepID=A0AAQ4DMC3_AMBAM
MQVPASVSHQAHVLLAVSSVIQVGAERARTRGSSSGLLTSAVSETLSSRGRQRQPRPTSSLPQQGWGRREAVTEPRPAAPGTTGQAHRTNEASVNVGKAVVTWTAATARDVVSAKGCGRWAISKVPASVSHQAHVLLAISSVIQVGAHRARTRGLSSGLLTSAVSESLSSRGRQRQPRPTSSLPQQGWGKREAVTEPGPAAPGSTGQAHQLFSPRRPLRHGSLSRQKNVGGGLFPSLGVLLESQCWAQSPNAASFYCLHSFCHVGGFGLDTASPAFTSHTKIWTRPRLPVLVEPHVPALCSAVLEDGGINKVPASVSHQAHVLLAISSVIQVGARRARTRVSSSGLLTSAVSETLSSRGRQRQPRPTSSQPQQGWGRREAVADMDVTKVAWIGGATCACPVLGSP